MNLAIILDAVTKEVPRHAKPYADARARRAPLAPYATPSDVLAALGKSSVVAAEERDAIVVALVEEAQSSRHQLWSSMLIAAFAPMLQRLRGRVRRPGNEDFDQRVLAAFVAAVRVVHPGRYTTIALRWATEKSVFADVRAEQRVPETLAFDENTHPADVFGIEEQAQTKVAEVVRALGLDADGELLDVVLSTRAGDVSLKEYVTREYAHCSETERRSEYERLCRTRLRIEREIRARLTARTAA